MPTISVVRAATSIHTVTTRPLLPSQKDEILLLLVQNMVHRILRSGLQIIPSNLDSMLSSGQTKKDERIDDDVGSVLTHIDK